MVFICTLFFSRLIVLDPPLNLTVEMKSSISVLLKWIAPLSSHEDITGYKVDVQKANYGRVFVVIFRAQAAWGRL